MMLTSFLVSDSQLLGYRILQQHFHLASYASQPRVKETMPPRKKSKVELLPPDPEMKPTRRAVVAAKHTVTYEAPEVVEIPVEEDEEESPAEGENFEQEQQPRQPSFRTKIRERFKARGIGVDETLNLRIDRLPLYEQNGFAGMKADREFCGIILCTEKLFETDEYLTEIQRRYGPGDYQLTVRHKNAIVSQWRERVGGFPLPVAVQSSEPGQPPQMFYPPNLGQTQIPAPRTVKEEMRDVAEIIKMVDSIRGPREEAPNPAPGLTDPDTILISSLAGNDKFMDKISNGLVGKLVGRGGNDDDPSPWAVAMKLVESGQAAQIIKTFVDSFFNGVNQMIPGRQNNGQATMAQAPNAPMGNLENQTQQNWQANQLRQDQNIQALTQGPENPPQAGAPTNPQQVSPEQDALALVLHHCRHKIPVKITLSELNQRENRLDFLLNQHAVQTGQILSNQITLYLDMFMDMSSDDAIAFVKSLPNGAEVASLPHAKEWTAELQRLIKDSQEGDEET